MDFSASTRFIPHDLDQKAITLLQDQLKKIHGLSEAYLVRKVLEESEASVYVLGATAGLTWRNGQHAQHVDALFEELFQMKGLPEPIIFLSLAGKQFHLIPTLKAIPGAQLYAAD